MSHERRGNDRPSSALGSSKQSKKFKTEHGYGISAMASKWLVADEHVNWLDAATNSGSAHVRYHLI
jgi:hypothetical protein